VFVSEDLAPRVRAISVDRETKVSDHQPVLLDLDER
jgi:endonuclease/exonuclease/phosphatase family metal-dependent hydrolase